MFERQKERSNSCIWKLKMSVDDSTSETVSRGISHVANVTKPSNETFSSDPNHVTFHETPCLLAEFLWLRRVWFFGIVFCVYIKQGLPPSFFAVKQLAVLHE